MNETRSWFEDNREDLFNLGLMVLLTWAGVENFFFESGTVNLVLGAVFMFFGVVGFYLTVSNVLSS